MKNILMLIVVINSCAQNPPRDARQLLINIWDYDYSMAYTTHYRVSNDSIIVTAISTVQGEGERILLSHALSQLEQKRMYDFISAFSFDRLEDKYVNELVEDGDRKKIDIMFGNKRKAIQVENTYQADIARLFSTLNEFLDKQVRIKYNR